ncbi:hypothetical protein GCM10008090_34470 [Arenicella chitinivorans]|uniref:Alpha/beta hydrolase fold-3 domain-containing protein n=1 Tax=Arenicella chitinivorans TaxID=1329800 RepID=A0A918S5H1_9GAMM|nr:alpha/beta hydrolase [Arenicella chitinivorans]GHA21654.1 hypothetical protein GCM10008090_34470 [Arenicella chitinivorans]
MTWIILFAVLLTLWLVAVFVLSGQDMRNFDSAVDDVFENHPEDEQAVKSLVTVLKDTRAKASGTRSIKKALGVVREFADNISADLETDSEFKQVTCDGVKAEWTIPQNCRPGRRILFLHGGAFIFGSPLGHRKMSDQLAKLAQAAVLSVDYRLMPEHGRKASIIDAQIAYQWLLQHDVDGVHALDTLLVAGDSAGGNLALMLASWSKTHTKRQPDAVIAFSPSTDMTMMSPTIKSNRLTDLMLGEGLGLLSRLPAVARAWIGLVTLRMNPANPLASPVFGDLSSLPPTLIHASSNEMLLGEAIRYANRAKAMGSDVTLQVWKDQIHDWHLFNLGYGSANHAWREVEKFIHQVVPVAALEAPKSASNH